MASPGLDGKSREGWMGSPGLNFKIWKVVWSGEAFGRFEGWMANPWVVTYCGRVANPFWLGEAFGTFWVWMANPWVVTSCGWVANPYPLGRHI